MASLNSTVTLDVTPEARDALRGARVEITHEPLTYHRHAPRSYFKDLILTDKTPGAEARLQQHAKEMRVIAKERAEKATRQPDGVTFEQRAEPSTLDGQGGYFSPPAWLNQFFATGKHAERVLADLIKATGGWFDLPPGVSTINLPIIGDGGTVAQPGADAGPVPDKAITDSAGTGNVVTIEGMADVALQLLEQSPAGAHIDWAIFKDMKESYDADLESQLICGTGSGTPTPQILGVINVPGITTINFTGSAVGTTMWPYFGQAFSQLADNRALHGECWLFRAGRYGWLMGQEDSSNRPLGLPSSIFLGNTDDTPDPLTGIYGLPMFGDESIPNTLTYNSTASTFSNIAGAAINQDCVICLRPSDLMLWEGEFQTTVDRAALAGSLGVRLLMHNYAAAVTSRFPTSIAVVAGSGMAYPSGS
jgi:HK97 family phage major capsid protein